MDFKFIGKDEFEHYCEKLNIIPIILKLKHEAGDNQVTPSRYISELKMTTEERLEQLTRPKRKTRLISELGACPFRAMPDYVIFQNFKPALSYSITLSIQNMQDVSHNLKMICEQSPIFSVSYSSGIIVTKIAPGMTMQFNVKFFPRHKKDYQHQVMFVTESGSFTVPILAIGPRPMLDLPDCVSMEYCPVNMTTERVLHIRNFGEVPAVFGAMTNAPFDVSPSNGILTPGDSMNMTIAFRPKKCCRVHDELVVAFESGEKLHVSLHARAVETNVKLEKGSVRFDDTYVGLTRQKNVRFVNVSEHIIHFYWKSYESDSVERNAKLRCVQMQTTQRVAFELSKIEGLRVKDLREDEAVARRVDDDDEKIIDIDDVCLFMNRNFSISPTSGQIWPDNAVEFTITFSPLVVGKYTCAAYLSVTGRENRLPMLMNGNGIGPQVEFNLHTLDVGLIFLCSNHCYELVVHNKGDIPGSVKYVPQNSTFGGIITCTPESVFLEPDACQTFTILFTSNHQGKFIEEIGFSISRSDELVKITIEGEVICPILVFEYLEMKFEKIPIGFPETRSVHLKNLSVVGVKYTLKISTDGTAPVIRCDQMTSGTRDILKLPKNPKELQVCPMEGVLGPESSVQIDVTLTPNVAGHFQSMIFFNIWNTDTGADPLVVSWSAEMPTLSSSDINIRFCFINYPYNRTIVVENTNDVKGYFYFCAQKCEEEQVIRVSVENDGLIIGARSSVNISTSVVTSVLGSNTVPIRIFVFGEQKPQVLCSITCIGQGPVISMNMTSISFGKTKLLEKTVCELTLTSDSPVPAEFTTSFMKPRSPFSVEPTCGLINADEMLEMNVMVTLHDCGFYSDKLIIQIVNGRTLTCQLNAEGVGTSIVVEPPLSPCFDFGYVFTRSRLERKLVMTNMGTRLHRLFWCAKKEKKLKDNKKSTEHTPVFDIMPGKSQLGNCETVELTLSCSHATIGEVDDCWCLYASIESSAKREVIMESHLHAIFVEPVVEFSKQEMLFVIEKGSEESHSQLQDTIVLTNRTKLLLHIYVEVDPPFMVLDSEHGFLKKCYTLVDYNMTNTITVYFQCVDDNNFHSYTVRGNMRLSYKNHHHVDMIALRAEVSFPNIELQPKSVHFDCIPNGAHSYKTILLKNVSPLSVYFEWKWKDKLFKVDEIEPYSTMDLMTKLARKQYSYKSLKETLNESAVVPSAEQVSNESEQSIVSLKEFSDVPCGDDLNMLHVSCEEITEMNTESIEGKVDHIDDDVVVEVGSEDKRTRCIKTALLELVGQSTKFDLMLPFRKHLPPTGTGGHAIYDVFDVTPFFGKLEPFETQKISIAFHPHEYTRTTGKLKCFIRGGPVETLLVTGTASDIRYYLEQREIDFGKQIFCRVCKHTLLLKNVGHLGFSYLVSRPFLDGGKSAMYFKDAGWLSVEPRKGYVSAGESVKFMVQYYPGISGNFLEYFDLEIGHNPPIQVTVKGCGIYPQVYLLLPRARQGEIDSSIGYVAIASLSSDLIEAHRYEHYDMDNTFAHFRSDNFTINDDGWEVVYNDGSLPTRMDVELAIERFITYRHLETHPEIVHRLNKQLMTTTTTTTAAMRNPHQTKIRCVPYLYTPSYVIDFGSVIVDTIVHSTCTLVNYGPARAMIDVYHPHASVDASNTGFKLQFTKLHDLEAGGNASIHVIFHPKLEVYEEKTNDVKHVFYLEVHQGARVPIEVRANVVMPYITAIPNQLTFSNIKCGQCQELSLLLKNDGSVPAEWKARVVRASKHHSGIKKKQIVDNDSFHIVNGKSATLASNQTHVMIIQFRPTKPGIHEMKIIFKVEMNKIDRLTVHLSGFAEEPRVEVDESQLKWEPALPFPEGLYKKITITNPCPFPVEFYLPEFDSQSVQEERLVKVLLKLYEAKELFVPPREPGEKLPHTFEELYTMLYEEALYKQRNQVMFDGVEQNTMTASSGVVLQSIAEGLDQKELFTVSVDDMKIAKKPKRVESQRRQSKIKSNSFMMPSLYSITEITPENYDLICEYAKKINSGNESTQVNTKVLSAVWHEYSPEPKIDPNEEKEGVFLIFHGAPFTDHVFMAHSVAKQLGFVVLNVDDMILESLASNSCLAATPVNEMINKLYNEAYVKHNTGINKLSQIPSPTKQNNDDDKVHDEDKVPSIWDIIENIREKIEFILNPPQMPPVGSELSAKKKDDDSKKGKKISVEISPELFNELLAQSFVQKFETGVVFDTLNSVFMKNPIHVLVPLLTLIGNMRYVHLLVVRMSHTSHVNYVMKINAEIETCLLDLKDEKLRAIDEMSADEYEQIDGVELDLYRTCLLTKRKLEREERRVALRQRIQDNMERRNLERKAKQMLKQSSKSTAMPKLKSKRDSKLSDAHVKVRVSNLKQKADTDDEKVVKKESKKEKDKAAYSSSASPSEVDAEYKDIFNSFEQFYKDIFIFSETWDRRPIKKSSVDLTETKKTTAPKTGHMRKKPSIVVVKYGSEDQKLGFPLWLVNNWSPEKPYLEILMNALKGFADLHTAVEKLKLSLIEKPKTVSRICSVLEEKPMACDLQHDADSFEMMNFDLANEIILENESENIINEPVVNENKRKSKARKSIKDTKKIDAVLLSDRKEASFIMNADTNLLQVTLKTRGVLRPGESHDYYVFFNPKKLGSYKHNYHIEVVGWPDSRCTIACEGRCELPHIDTDPYVMFEQVKNVADEMVIPDRVYFLDTQTFNFGAAFVNDADKHECSCKSTHITLANVSKMKCDVSFSQLVENDSFKFYPACMEIPPGASKRVLVQVLPMVVGDIETEFLILTRNNPKIDIVRMSITGCKFDFEIDDRVIDFSRVVLFRKAQRFATLINKCLVPILWEFDNAKVLDDTSFDVSAVRGVIEPQSEIKIGIEYTALKVESILELCLDLKIYDYHERATVLHNDSLILQAESYDVELDIYYAQMDFTHVQFGDVKVQYKYEQFIGFFNRGKYPINFEISMNKELKLNCHKSKWQIEPKSGVLIPKSLFPCVISCIPKRKICLREKPLYHVVISDVQNKLPIAKIPINVSITSHYSQYTICPCQVDFGAMVINDEKVINVIIKNTGKFQFRYKIEEYIPPLSPEEFQKVHDDVSSGSVKRSKRDSKTTVKTAKSAKASGKKVDHKNKASLFLDKDLKMGMFTVNSTKGTVQPNSDVAIKITCGPNNAGDALCEVRVFISESLPRDQRRGHFIKIQANACLPAVDFENYERIFRESYVVDDITNFVVSKEMAEHTVFSINNRTLYFLNVCFQKEVGIKIRLYNTSAVPATIKAHLSPVLRKSNEGYMNHLQMFVVDTEITIAPYTESPLSMKFIPKVLETFFVSLEFCLIGPTGDAIDKMVICMQGDVLIPQICILEPKASAMNQYDLIYEPMLTGCCTRQAISIKNISSISAELIVEIRDDKTGLFAIELTEETLHKAQFWDCKGTLAHHFLIDVLPRDTISFNVVFCPVDVGIFVGNVFLYVVNNPFENTKIGLRGASYREDVCVEGLDIIMPLQIQADTPSVSHNIYRLDFGYQYVEKLAIISFSIVNHTDDLHKFEFTHQVDNLTFMPTVGHLAAKEKFDIIASFVGIEPMILHEALIELCIVKIIYSQEEYMSVPQDQHLKRILQPPSEEDTTGSLVKVLLESDAELSHMKSYNIIPDTERTLQIKMSVVVDYCSYSCDTEEIIFSDTQIYDEQKYSFTVQNSSEVPLILNWSLTMDERYPNTMSNQMENGCDIPLSTIEELKMLRRNSSKSLDTVARPLSGNEQFLKIDNEDNMLPHKVSFLFHSNNSQIEKNNHFPFEIMPKSVVIAPLGTETFIVTFAPTAALVYKVFLKSQIPYLNPTFFPMTIVIRGRGVISYYSFDVELSDYLESKRRDMQLPELYYKWKVIELSCVGIGVSLTKTFPIFNPSSTEITYTWRKINPYIEIAHPFTDVELFHCETRHGVIRPGKVETASFRFYSTKCGTFEDYYRFYIEKYNIEINFLFVIHVSEPRVYFNMSALQLKPTLVGVKVTDTIALVNKDNEQFRFSLATDSLFSESGGLERLIVEPMDGVLKPNSTTHLSVSLIPNTQGETVFDLKSSIEYKQTPLRITVYGMSYVIQSELQCEVRMSLIRSIENNIPFSLDLGNVIVGRSNVVYFTLSNHGKTKFFYVWNFDCGKYDGKFSVEIGEDKGNVPTNSQVVCRMAVIALKKATMKDLTITLQIPFGPTYIIMLSVCSTLPAFKFSFDNHDFGKCFIRPPPQWIYKKELKYTNLDSCAQMLVCKHEDTEFVYVNCETHSIAPKETVAIDIHFQPRKVQSYVSRIPFLVNSHSHDVIITGEGIELLVELVDPCDKVINFGSIMVNDVVQKIVRVKNHSKAHVDVIFNINDKLPFIRDGRLYPKVPSAVFYEPPLISNKSSKSNISLLKSHETDENKREESQLARVRWQKVQNSLHVAPDTMVRIGERDVIDVIVKFAPKTNVEPFNEQLSMQLYGRIEPLSIIKGSTLRKSIELNTNTISFGVVLKNNSMLERFMLTNNGDIGAKFKWNFRKKQTMFSLEPMEGYCAAGSKVKMVARFTPTTTSDCMHQSEAVCQIKGFKNKMLVLTGRCEDITESDKILEFICPVRDYDVHEVELFNNTTRPWPLNSILTGKYFSCDKNVIIPAQSKINFSITYSPLVMIQNDETHEGNILLKLPRGCVELYKLKGFSKQPLPARKITLEATCKKMESQMLEVKSWLATTQHFVITTNLVSPNNASPLYTVDGSEYITLDGFDETSYQWSVYLYLEGFYTFKVFFTDVDTGEYMFYEIYIKCSKPEPIETIELTTPVRRMKTYNILVRNPLNKDIVFHVICPNNEITVVNMFEVSANSEVALKLEYFPMIVGSKPMILELRSEALGTFPYELILNALQPLPEKTLICETSLGQIGSTFGKIHNYCKTKIDFISKLDNPKIFTVEKVTVGAEQDSEFVVVFEPNEIRNFQGYLTLSSPLAGEYLFPIVGKCTPPTPQGPYKVTASNSATISFYNTSFEDKVFRLFVVPDVFSVKNATETIKARTERRIIVSMKSKSTSYPVTGKLIITCQDPALSHIKWTFYLCGDTNV